MKIKNKDLFVERATEHKKLDRFLATCYVTEDGPEKGFEGCFIGCMSLPSGISAARRRIRALNKDNQDWLKTQESGDFKDDYWFWEAPDLAMVEQIEKEFGICRGLQRVAEFLLMGLPADSPARLGGFVLSFAKAVPEGVDVTDERVIEWLESRTAVTYGGYLNGRQDHERDKWVDGPFAKILQFNVGHNLYGEILACGESLDSELSEAERKAFLDWCRRGCPKPRVAA